MPKVRKIPQRTCLGCQTVQAKREMTRIVRLPSGEVQMDPTGKKSGRGTYVCQDPACLERAFAGNRLEKALDVTLTAEQRETLRAAITGRR